MKLRFLGHSSLLIEVEGTSILVDPFITANTAAKHLVDEINPDIILLTHAHQDHVLDTELFAKKRNALVIANYEVANHYAAKGLRATGMNHGGTVVENSIHMKMVNAVHTSAFADGSNGGDPAGFVVWTSDKCIYLSGDTALTMDMKLIPMTCPSLDAAVLCLGDHFTMGYMDAAIASDFVACDRVIGSHFDTFPPIRIDRAEVSAYFKSKNKDLHLMEVGEYIEI